MPPLDVAQPRAGADTVNDDVFYYLTSKGLSPDRQWVNRMARKSRIYLATCHRWTFNLTRKLFTISSDDATNTYFVMDTDFSGELTIKQQGKKLPSLEYISPSRYEELREDDSSQQAEQSLYTISDAQNIYPYPLPKINSVFIVWFYKSLLDDKTALPPDFGPAVYNYALHLCGAPAPEGGPRWFDAARDAIEKLIRIDAQPNQGRVDVRLEEDVRGAVAAL